MERQLDIFKGKRQRGVQLPKPKEEALHFQVEDICSKWLMPDWIYTHLPMGEKRDPRTAARLKAMGTKRGWPDFLFIRKLRADDRMAVFFLELKRKGNRPTEEQEYVAGHLMASGCGYHWTDNFEDALSTLRSLGIVRASVSA